MPVTVGLSKYLLNEARMSIPDVQTIKIEKCTRHYRNIGKGPQSRSYVGLEEHLGTHQTENGAGRSKRMVCSTSAVHKDCCILFRVPCLSRRPDPEVPELSLFAVPFMPQHCCTLQPREMPPSSVY